MNSYRRNDNRERSSLFGALLIVLLIATSIFGFDFFTGGILRAYTRTAGSIVWTAASGTAGAIDISGVFATKRSLAKENASLVERLSQSEEQQSRFKALEAENAALREMAHLAQSQEGVTARVVSAFRSSPYGTFIIATGKNDGIKAGSLVLTSGGFVLGSVTSVDERTATVQSLFAPGAETDFHVSDLAFTATGRGGGNTKANVPRDASVAIGDVVIAPTFGGKAAGVVGSIESASSSATKTLFIRIPVNLATLIFVYVIPQ